jgi:hypothetical protein
MEKDMQTELSLDKTSFSITSLEAPDESEFWLSQSPEARINHIETLRRINYGDAASERLQRVFDIIQLNDR